MGGRTGGRTEPRATSAEGSTLALERFGWSAPDRLEVVGRFVNVPEDALSRPVLVVRSGGSTHRLDTMPQPGPRSRQGRRRFGTSRWSATFVWPWPPRPFESAWLELGDELVVELPPPNDRRPERRSLDVVQRPANALSATDALRMQTELAAAREEAEDARERLQEAEEMVRRLRKDLLEQRGRREAEATRFQEALGTVRATAEEAIAAERESAEAVRAEAQAAREEAEKRGREEGRQVSVVREALERATRERDTEVQRIAALRAGLDGLAQAGGELSARIERLRMDLGAAAEPGSGEEGTKPRDVST